MVVSLFNGWNNIKYPCWRWKQLLQQMKFNIILISTSILIYIYIYINASNYQLGVAILKQGQPVAYWYKKLTPTQKNNNTMEKELLAIVLWLKEYSNILYGERVNIYMDHRNLTFQTLSVVCVIRWALSLEDYDINFTYCSRKYNKLADEFLRLPRMEVLLLG